MEWCGNYCKYDAAEWETCDDCEHNPANKREARFPHCNKPISVSIVDED